MTVKLRHIPAAVAAVFALAAPASAFAAADPAELMNAGALRGATDAQVCLVDTGVDNTSELQGASVTRVSMTGRSGADMNRDKHGTVIAETFAGRNVGLIPGARVLSVEVEGASTATVAAAFDLCVQRGANVINWSAAADRRSPALDAAAQRACAADALVFVAAGNTNGGAARATASTPCVIAVGSTDLDGHWDALSARGAGITILAPGAGWTAAGTSVASVEAAGVAAGLRALLPQRNAGEVRDAILAGARQRPAGRVVDVAGALRILGQGDLAAASVPPVAGDSGRVSARDVSFRARRVGGQVVVSAVGDIRGGRLRVRVGRDSYTGAAARVVVSRVRLPRAVRAELTAGARVVAVARVAVR